MPIYEYECEQCRHCFEKLVFGGDDIAVQCPRCGGDRTKKLISCTRIIGDNPFAGCASSPFS